MKTANKILSVFLAVLMLFSVMSVGLGGIVAIAHTVTVDGAADDTYETTDDVIIAVPETIYMTPGHSASTTGQYFVNNIVGQDGRVSVTAEKSQTNGSISIWAPGSTAFSFKANAITGGIGDPIICDPGSKATYEAQRWANTDLGGTTGYCRYDALGFYINGTGLTTTNTALVEWEVTIYYGDNDTTGKTYYAYTTLYAPHYSVGAIAESRRSGTYNNEIASWVSGVTSSGSAKSTLGVDRVGDGAPTADGYFKYDPLWVAVGNGGSSETANDYVNVSDSMRYVHAVAVNGAQWSRSIGYTGYLTVDSSRYSNTNQVPNFQIGGDILRANDGKNDSVERFYVWYTLGNGNETIGIDQDSTPSGWTQLFYEWQPARALRAALSPSYNVSEINGKHLHIASQGYCTYLSDKNYANAYISVVFSVTDKSDLRAAVIQATGLDGTKYTQNSWSGASATVIDEFRAALRDAAEVLGDPAVAQGAIDGALSTLRAKMNALKVTIKFDAATNGGVFTDNKATKEYDIQFGTKKIVGLKAAMLNYFSAARNGYEFIGWTTSPDNPEDASLTNVDITFGDTLYAHYRKTISVDFWYLAGEDGKTDVDINELTIYNQDNKVLDVDVDDADDVGEYKFAGWTTDPSSTKGEELGDALTGITENTAYYATYNKTLTLTLDANGGNCDDAYLESGIGYNYDLTQSTGAATVTLPSASRTGYGFKGWDIGGTVYQAGDTVELAQNATATAIWEADIYTVTFNYKDAEGNDVSVSQQIAHGNAATAPEVPEYYSNQTMHYKFTAWDSAFDNITGDITITAVYASGVMHNYTYTGNFPTCDEAGKVVYTCSICNYSYTYSSGALGHEYVITDSKDATCEEDGYITYVCNRDTNHTYTDIIPATGHSFENTEYVAPDCTTDGYYISGTCANCGEDLAGVVIPAFGHDYSIELEHKDATCEEDGYTKYECSRCGEEYTEIIPATGHDYTFVITSPNCTTAGKIVYTCANDPSHTYTEELPATGHSYATIIFAPTCTSEGYTSQTCTTCGHSTKSNIVPALGHSYTTVVVDPTCTKQGYTNHVCAVCGFSYKTDYVDATGHDFSIITVIAPTCTEKGYTLNECSVCGTSYKSDIIPAAGHVYEFVKYVAATATQNAYDLYECSVCGIEYRDYYYGNKTLLAITLKDSSGAAVPNATVVFTNVETGEQIEISTDANGYFTNFIPDGTYTITASGHGYFSTASGKMVSELGLVSELKLPSVAKNNCKCPCHKDTFWSKIFTIIIKLFSIFGKIYCCDCCEIWD